MFPESGTNGVPAGAVEQTTTERTINGLTDSEIAALEGDPLDIHADFTVMATILHAPGPDDPEDHWILERMIDGQWSRPFTAGLEPDDALIESRGEFGKYVEK